MALGWVKISMGWVKVWKAVYLNNISSSCGANYTRFRNWLVGKDIIPRGNWEEQIRSVLSGAWLRAVGQNTFQERITFSSEKFSVGENYEFTNAPIHCHSQKGGWKSGTPGKSIRIRMISILIKADGGNGHGVEGGPVHRHLCRPPPHHRHHPLHPHQHLPGEQFNLTATLIGLLWQK